MVILCKRLPGQGMSNGEALRALMYVDRFDSATDFGFPGGRCTIKD